MSLEEKTNFPVEIAKWKKIYESVPTKRGQIRLAVLCLSAILSHSQQLINFLNYTCGKCIL